MPVRLSRCITLGALAGLLAFTSQAQASGFDAPTRIGSIASGPVTRDAAAVHHNPGQLGFFKRPELLLGAGVILGSIGYQRERLGQYQYEDNLDFAEPIDPMDIDPSKTGQARPVKATPVGPVFEAFAAIPVVRDRFTLGLGLYVPYAALLELPAAGAQRFQAQSITLIAPHMTLSAGVKLHRVVAIGASVTYVLGYLNFDRIQDFGAVDAFGQGLSNPPISQENDFGNNAPTTVRELNALARPLTIERSFSHGVTFNAGIAIRPTDKIDLAFVYQHGSQVNLKGQFSLDMDDDFFTEDLAGQGLQYPARVEGDTVNRFRLPKRLTLGAGGQVHRMVYLDGALSYVFWQDFDRIAIRLESPQLAQPELGLGPVAQQDIVRNWKGTVHVFGRARIEPIKRLMITALLGYQSPASPDSTIDMGSPDGHRILFGPGAGWTFGDRITLMGGFEGQAIIPRKVVTSDFDLGNGRYKMFLSAVTVHAQIRLGKAPADKKKAPAAKPEPSAKPEPTPAAGTNDTPAPPASPPAEPAPPVPADQRPPPPPPPPPP